MIDTKNIDRIGVAKVQDIVCSRLHWIFREQVSDDYGVDAHIEIKENCYACGKIIGVQIKTGDSYFNKSGDKGKIIFNEKHYRYWKNYSLPVIVIFVNTTTSQCYWEHIHVQTIEEISNKKYKIVSNTNHIFDESAKNDLLKLAKGIYVSLPSKKTMEIYKSLDVLNINGIEKRKNYKLLDIEKILDIIKNSYNDNIQRNAFSILRDITNGDFSRMDFSGLNLYGINFNQITLRAMDYQTKFENTVLYINNFINYYGDYSILHIDCVSDKNLEVWLKNDIVQTWDLNIFRCINTRKQKCNIIDRKKYLEIFNNKLSIGVDDSLYYNKIYVTNKEEQVVKIIEPIVTTDVYGCDFSKAFFVDGYLKELLYQNGAIVDQQELFKDI